MTDTVVEIDCVTKTFDDVLAVDRVSLSLQRGETLGLIGPNGAGKTTLLPNGLPAGQFQLKIKNETPFDFSQTFLVVGVSPAISKSSQAITRSLGRYTNLNSVPAEFTLDLYQIKAIQPLQSGGVHNEVFNSAFTVMHQDWAHSMSWDRTRLRAPKLATANTVRAWIVAQITDSPIMTIYRPGTDFKPITESHIILQEVDAESLPDFALFQQAVHNPNPTKQEDGALPEGSNQ